MVSIPIKRPAKPIRVHDYFTEVKTRMLAEVVGMNKDGAWDLLDANGPLDGPTVSVYAGVLNNPVLWTRLERGVSPAA